MHCVLVLGSETRREELEQQQWDITGSWSGETLLQGRLVPLGWKKKVGER